MTSMPRAVDGLTTIAIVTNARRLSAALMAVDNVKMSWATCSTWLPATSCKSPTRRFDRSVHVALRNAVTNCSRAAFIALSPSCAINRDATKLATVRPTRSKAAISTAWSRVNESPKALMFDSTRRKDVAVRVTRTSTPASVRPETNAAAPIRMTVSRDRRKRSRAAQLVRRLDERSATSLLVGSAVGLGVVPVVVGL